MTRRTISTTERVKSDVVHQCLALIRQGVKQREIAAILGASKSSVSRWCQEAVRESDAIQDRRLVNNETATLSQMVWARIEHKGPNECWPWIGHIKSNGYGSLNYKGKAYQAHRATYECFVANIPDGFVVDHKCRNSCCCNPRHLQCVTQSENLYLIKVRA